MIAVQSPGLVMALKTVKTRLMAVTLPAMTVTVVTVAPIAVVVMILVMIRMLAIMVLMVIVNMQWKIMTVMETVQLVRTNAVNAAVTDLLSNVLTAHWFVMRLTVLQKIRMYIL
jgi:hypothetical protein